MLSVFVSGLQAGLLISVGGTVFLSLDNRVAGAVFFTVALLCICMKGYALFTGRVGFLPENRTAREARDLLLCLAGNAAGTALGGLAVRLALPSLGGAAGALAAAKLAQTAGQTLLRAVFCGMLMYLAVSIWRERGRTEGILFCVPVFILCGFEHSVADMFYFAAAAAGPAAVLYVLIVIAGNAAGGVLLPLLSLAGKAGGHGE